MTELFFRHGNKPIQPNTTIGNKPALARTKTCGRCGGRGGSDAWKFTGWRCFDCGGSGTRGTEVVPLYTLEQIEKLNATAQKKADAKRAKLEAVARAKAEAKAAAAAALRPAFEAKHAAVLAWLTQCVVDAECHPFLADMWTKAREDACWTDRQEAAVYSFWTRAQEKAARQALDDASNWVGQVGERLRKIGVNVLGHVKFETAFGMRHITTMRVSGSANLVVVKSGSWRAERGQNLLITCTVAKHDTYKGVCQTRLSRVITDEIITEEIAA